MPVTSYDREYLSEDLWNDIVPLLRAHWREIARYKDIRLEPDYDFYHRAEQQDMLRIFTARDDRGQLFGYSVFFVKYNPHYKNSLQAVQDILYFDPTQRRGLAGYRFIRWCDDQLRAEGVQVVMHHVKVYKDFGKILERMGYEAVDTIYARRLDGNHSSIDSSDSHSSGSRSGRGEENGPETAVGDGCAAGSGEGSAGCGGGDRQVATILTKEERPE